jgi:hypothetical protein
VFVIVSWIASAQIATAEPLVRQCANFKSRDQAQNFYETYKDEPEYGDVSKLPVDQDGQVCTSYPYAVTPEPTQDPDIIFTLGDVSITSAGLIILPMMLFMLAVFGSIIFYNLKERFTPSKSGIQIAPINTPASGRVDYQTYIHSAEWRQRAAAAKQAANNRCQVCNSTGELHTHHRTYATLGNEQPGDLIVLCARCHHTFHQNGRLVR